MDYEVAPQSGIPLRCCDFGGVTPALEDVGIFNFSNEDEDDDIVADMNNIDTTIQVSLTLTTIIHKDHPLDQVIGDLYSATQTKNMTKNLEEHGFVSSIQPRKNHKDLQNCLIACFLSQEEPKKMDVKSAFPYGKIEEEVFTEVKNASTPMKTQKPLLKDEDGEEVDVHIYRLISWQCKKQIVVANSTTEVEYVVASSCRGQFWSTAMAKTINGESQIHAMVDSKEIIITESSVRRDLRLADEGVTTAGTTVKTASKSYYRQYKEVNTAQFKVSVAQEL
nr:hypothetical protein [Tanacetum cinerariifolium]